MARAQGTENPSVIELEARPVEDESTRLRVLSLAGLEYLGRVVEWATKILGAEEADDPLSQYTPRQTNDAARIGTLAAVELANKRFPKLTQTRQENVNLNDLARALIEDGKVDPDVAKKRLERLRQNVIPNQENERRRLLARAHRAERVTREGEQWSRDSKAESANSERRSGSA